MSHPLLSATLLALPLAVLALPVGTAAQQQKQVAYPGRDALTPFRTPAEVYAPPDALYAVLRRMRAIAEDPKSKKDFDAEGREIVDDDGWREARKEADRIGIDASYLAAIMRTSKNNADRATAFYATFFCKQPDYVTNLISHIPGEPERAIRQAAFPRAIAWLHANLNRRFGDLSEEQKKAIVSAMPEPGSPAAKSAGIKRKPIDQDHLHDLRLIPFFQLLDLDEPMDQAQGLWFLKEVFLIRKDLALLWLEPSLPRVRDLLAADDATVRKEAIGLLAAIGPAKLEQPALDAQRDKMQAWADLAIRELFPPIRNLNDAVVQLQPSPDRDAIVAAGIKVLESGAIGDPTSGKMKDGALYRGLRISHVPDELKALAIPRDAVITAVNGANVSDAASLLRTVREQIEHLRHPRVIRVEYVFDGSPRAVEYRLM